MTIDTYDFIDCLNEMELHDYFAELHVKYNVKNSVVVSPGQFENKPVWVPYFYHQYPHDNVFDDRTELLGYQVTPRDRTLFPELKNAEWVVLHEDDHGAHGKTMKDNDWFNLIRKLEDMDYNMTFGF